MKKNFIATQQKPFEKIVSEFPSYRRYAQRVFLRLSSITALPEHAEVLDVGAGSGLLTAAAIQLGYNCVGIEPLPQARLSSVKLFEYLKLPLSITEGKAEAIPFADGKFDIVLAKTAMEHVLDVERAFQEIFRVTKPGGVFWFYSTSAMSPFQNEIKGFPFFGWYPASLKSKIMHWAKVKRPYLVSYTKTPAINWFTPAKTRLRLHKCGFTKVYDRWDLRREEAGRRLHKIALRSIRANKILRFLADVAFPDCSYAAIK